MLSTRLPVRVLAAVAAFREGLNAQNTRLLKYGCALQNARVTYKLFLFSMELNEVEEHTSMRCRTGVLLVNFDHLGVP